MYFLQLTNRMNDGSMGNAVCVNMEMVSEFFDNGTGGTLLLLNFTTGNGEQAFVHVCEIYEQVIASLPKNATHDANKL